MAQRRGQVSHDGVGAEAGTTALVASAAAADAAAAAAVMVSSCIGRGEGLAMSGLWGAEADCGTTPPTSRWCRRRESSPSLPPPVLEPQLTVVAPEQLPARRKRSGSADSWRFVPWLRPCHTDTNHPCQELQLNGRLEALVEVSCQVAFKSCFTCSAR